MTLLYNKHFIYIVLINILLSLFFFPNTKTWAESPFLPEGKKVENIGGEFINHIVIDNNDAVWIGTRESGVSRYDGETWTTFTSENGLPADVINAMATGPDGEIWVCTGTYNFPGGFLGHGISCFDGTKWTTFTSEDGLPSNNVSKLAVGPDGNVWIYTYDYVYNSEEPEYPYHSGTGLSCYDGNTWATPISNKLPISSLSVDSNGLVYIGYPEGIYTYDGAELTDFSIGTYDESALQLIVTDDVVYARFHDKIKEYKNGQWFDLFSGGISHPGRPNSIAVDQDGVLWGCDDYNFYSYEYYVWIFYGVNQKEAKLRSIAFDSQGTIWIGSQTGLYKITNDIPSSVSLRNKKPQQISLNGNYPNPFNSSTAIEFTLQLNDTVTLSVYDITGRKISQLMSGKYDKGTYSAVWDGRDDSGNQVSSGVYFSRLESTTNAITHRMLLLK